MPAFSSAENQRPIRESTVCPRTHAVNWLQALDVGTNKVLPLRPVAALGIRYSGSRRRAAPELILAVIRYRHVAILTKYKVQHMKRQPQASP